VILFRLFCALFYSLWILITPFYWVIAKIFKLNHLKKDLCSVLNTLYNTDTFHYNDYITICYLFNGFVFKHKKTKTILAIGHYAWSGSLRIETDLIFPESVPDISPLHFDNSPIKNSLYVQYSKGIINKINQKITIEFESNEPVRLAQKTIYKDIAFTKNRRFEILALSLETYDLEDMYGNQIDYQEYPVAGYTINDLYLAYITGRMKEDPMAVSILPELVHDSVCDYQSSQFTDRLLLLEMVKF